MTMKTRPSHVLQQSMAQKSLQPQQSLALFRRRLFAKENSRCWRRGDNRTRFNGNSITMAERHFPANQTTPRHATHVVMAWSGSPYCRIFLFCALPSDTARRLTLYWHCPDCTDCRPIGCTAVIWRHCIAYWWQVSHAHLHTARKTAMNSGRELSRDVRVFNWVYFTCRWVAEWICGCDIKSQPITLINFIRRKISITKRQKWMDTIKHVQIHKFALHTHCSGQFRVERRDNGKTCTICTRIWMHVARLSYTRWRGAKCYHFINNHSLHWTANRNLRTAPCCTKLLNQVCVDDRTLSQNYFGHMRSSVNFGGKTFLLKNISMKTMKVNYIPEFYMTFARKMFSRILPHPVPRLLRQGRSHVSEIGCVHLSFLSLQTFNYSG